MCGRDRAVSPKKGKQEKNGGKNGKKRSGKGANCAWSCICKKESDLLFDAMN